MSKPATDVFELEIIGPVDRDFQIRVAHPLCGQRYHTMTPPFDVITSRSLLKLLESNGRLPHGLTNLEEAALQQVNVVIDGRPIGMESLVQLVGHELFQSLFPASEKRDEDIRGALEMALHRARQNSQPLPVQLRFGNRAVDLASMPWELVRDESGPLVASGRLRLTRYVTFGEPTNHFPIVDRIAVLVVSPRPLDLANLNDAEPQAIHTAFSTLEKAGLIRLEQLSPCTFEALVAAINHYPYHILHFDGHGGFVRRCPRCDRLQPADRTECENKACREPLVATEPQGCLAFERQGGSLQKQLVRAEELATVLSRTSIRLCVVSACQSAMLSGTNVFNSVGPKLVETGVPAVVGMQFSVPSTDAITFIQEFYTNLAQSKSIAAATDAGRRLLFAKGHWYIPTTYLRSEDGEGFLFDFHDPDRILQQKYYELDARGTGTYLLPAGMDVAQWTSEIHEHAVPYKGLRSYDVDDRALFFGRLTEIDALLASVVDPNQRITVLVGSAGVGKTSLVNAGLIPELLVHGYAVLILRGCGNPMDLIRQALANSTLFDVDMSSADDLLSTVDVLMGELGRPLLFVFDEFEEFLNSNEQSIIQQFGCQLAKCVKSQHPLPLSFLLVLREDFQSRLGIFQAEIPGIFDRPILLKPLTRQEAEYAIARPISLCKLPVAYDATFLTKTLLVDLATETAAASPETVDDSINPTYLQIVCQELVQAASQMALSNQPGTAYVIGEELYARWRTGTILGSYLNQKLAEHFLDPASLQSARTLLKQMVTQSGERQFRGPVELAQLTKMKDELVLGILTQLATDGLVAMRTTPNGQTEYSVGHRFLAQQIRKWFDPEEALRQCAQDILDQAWHSWRANWQIHFERFGTIPQVKELLIGPDQLDEIRIAQEISDTNAKQLKINPVEYCLLLRSAVHHRRDMAFWAHDIQKNPKAISLLDHVQSGIPGESTELSEEEIRMAVAVVGLSSNDLQQYALSRGAVQEQDGEVRHTAALALTALGLQAVHDAIPTLRSARPVGRFWRSTQVLAQIRVAGFPLPALSLSTRWWLNIWATGILAWDNRLSILLESFLAGLGAGFGLSLALLTVAILWMDQYGNASLVLSAFVQPLGLVIGMSTVIFARVLCLLGSSQNLVRRAIGIWIGFTLGLSTVLLPFSLGSQYIYGITLDRAIEIALRHVVGGGLWGLGIGLGFVVIDYLRPQTILLHALASGIGGAIGCSFAVVLNIYIPFVQRDSTNLFVPFVAAALFGFAVGAGLSGGWVLGARIYRKLRPTQNVSVAFDMSS